MKRLLLVLFAMLGSLVWGEDASAGKLSGKTLSLKREALNGVRVEALAVDENGVVDRQTPIKTELSKADGSYEIDVGAAPRVILRFFRADRNETFLPNLPTATTGGAISGLNDLTKLDVLIPALDEVPQPYPTYEPCCQPSKRLFGRLFRR